MKKAMLLIAGMLSVLALSPSPARAEAQGPQGPWSPKPLPAASQARNEARIKEIIASPALPVARGAGIFRPGSDGRMRLLSSVEQVSKTLEDLQKRLSQLQGSRI